jgi:hypothetical protein
MDGKIHNNVAAALIVYADSFISPGIGKNDLFRILRKNKSKGKQ